MPRVYNFSAGPSILPEEVLRTAAAEMLDYRGTGTSVMEMSHRSKAFTEIIEDAERLLRELMDIPDNYKVLFLQGGASTQFAMVPLNLMAAGGKADYVVTGAWAKKAAAQAKQYGTVNVVASSEDATFTYIPELKPDTFDAAADYAHVTMNNTIYGTRYAAMPPVGDVTLVADMSSNILSQPFDIKQFGLVYAGAQKNIGPAGMTVVIIREDLVGRAQECTPIMLNYETHTGAGSLYNTPPCYAIYIAKLVFELLKDKGGVPAMFELNQKKSGLLYEYLDSSSLFAGTVKPECRSLMNVPFVLPSDELNAAFIKQAEAQGLVNLKGHRTVGGMRASIYNAMPLAGVEALVDFMKQFETQNS